MIKTKYIKGIYGLAKYFILHFLLLFIKYNIFDLFCEKIISKRDFKNYE